MGTDNRAFRPKPSMLARISRAIFSMGNAKPKAPAARPTGKRSLERTHGGHATHAENRANQVLNRRARAERRKHVHPDTLERQRIRNRMTNWQATQWSRAGTKGARFPGKLKTMRHFAGLQRPVHAVD